MDLNDIVNYKHIRQIMIAILVFTAIMFLGLTKSITFLGLNQVNIPSPLSYIGMGVFGYMAYYLYKNY